MLENLLETQQLANKLMGEHGLLEKVWTFRFSNKKTAVGTCQLGKKVITYSKWYTNAPIENRTQTALHEIAHALVYEEVGRVYKHGGNDWHGRLWRKKMLEIGDRPERPAQSRFNGNYNWLIECPTEGCEAGPWRRHRLREMVWYAKCPNCHSHLLILDLNSGDIYQSTPHEEGVVE